MQSTSGEGTGMLLPSLATLVQATFLGSYKGESILNPLQKAMSFSFSFRNRDYVLPLETSVKFLCDPPLQGVSPLQGRALDHLTGVILGVGW